MACILDKSERMLKRFAGEARPAALGGIVRLDQRALTENMNPVATK